MIKNHKEIILGYQKYRYIFLAVLLILALSFLNIHRSMNVYDFWEHSAVINELQHNLTSPQHPILVTESDQHAFFSPYHLFLAFLSKLFFTDSISILLAFGIINLISFLILLPFVIKSLYNHELSHEIAFYSLLLILLLWGSSETWAWSGYFNIVSFRVNLSYPSFFVLNLFMISIIIFKKSFAELKFAILFLIIYVFVLLCHPTSFLPIIIFHGFFLINKTGLEFDKKYFYFILIVLLSLIIVYFYPYYPFYKIFIDPETKLFEKHSFHLYKNFLINVWPLLIALPLLFINGFDKTLKDPLFHTIILLSLAYLIGYLYSSYGIGRVMGYIFLFFHLLLAKNIAVLEKRKKGYATISILTIIILVSLNLGRLPERFFPQFLAGPQEVENNLIKGRKYFKKEKDEYSKFKPLPEVISHYDVVLSDLNTSWFIPSFSGKVIASKHPVYFQKDANERRKSLSEFFKENTSNERRREILLKYNVDYILINHTLFPQSNQVFIDALEFGRIIFQNEEITIIKYVQGEQ